jgi:hypothetical protein
MENDKTGKKPLGCGGTIVLIILVLLVIHSIEKTPKKEPKLYTGGVQSDTQAVEEQSDTQAVNSRYLRSVPDKQLQVSAELVARCVSKGWMQVGSDSNSVYVKVEPLLWKRFTHIRKQKLVQAVMNITWSDAKGQAFVIFMGMTSGNTLARGYLDSGRIEIFE